ncbi:sulfatase-like hydrolase/transferase [Gemmata sp. G18]|uniref:Sulfatase-like hydrolase/transferase n=1 Tax=Gemmata palustris TaxID=2822762 RepID=A0ABS5BKA4_9BACT|nr:sulfatase-like hydrolase/transferase [Gemmata palustris]MBP3954138.1 sulfatase-like hydrolase/transferase [Gemmata palustris]
MKVIFFALNGCPAGWLGAYGNDWVGTPHLDRLASEAVTFDRHMSDCPEPTAARRAWLGGEPNPPAPFPEKEGGAESTTVGTTPVLPLVLSPFLFRGGVGERSFSSLTKTILVRANHPDTDAPDWFYAGWDEVFDARPQADDDSPLDELLRAFPAILDRLANVPDFLLWIETDRLIPPWDVQQDVFEAYLEDEEDSGERDEEPTEDEQTDAGEETAEGETGEEDEPEIDDDPEPLNPDPRPPVREEEPVAPFADPPTGPFDRSDLDAWDWLRCTFAAVVTKLDAELGALFDHLRARELGQSATWIVTSDFGHPLGEHGQIGLHRPWLHEELVHLPLLMRLPQAEQAGRRVSGFTQPPDVFSTLQALFGIDPPASTNGLNLLPLARGEAESARAFVCTRLELGDATEIAIRTEDSALLVPTRAPEGDSSREPLLYEKPDDRWEVNDIRARNIDRADELEAKLREELQSEKSPRMNTENTD